MSVNLMNTVGKRGFLSAGWLTEILTVCPALPWPLRFIAGTVDLEWPVFVQIRPFAALSIRWRASETAPQVLSLQRELRLHFGAGGAGKGRLRSLGPATQPER